MTKNNNNILLSSFRNKKRKLKLRNEQWKFLFDCSTVIKMVKITRYSTCVTLDLPPKLGCHFCERQLEKVKSKRRNVKSCLRPFDSRFAHHCEQLLIKRYKDIHDYLGLEYSHNMDSLVDTYLYSDRKQCGWGPEGKWIFSLANYTGWFFSDCSRHKKTNAKKGFWRKKNKNKGGNMQSAYMK